MESATEETPLLYAAEMLLLVARDNAHRQCLLIARPVVCAKIVTFACRDRGAGQLITDLQALATQSTDVLPHHRGSTAKARLDRKTCCDTKVAATAGGGKAYPDNVSGCNRVHLPQGPLCAVDTQWHGRAGEADPGIHLGLQLQATDTDFNNSTVRGILQ